MDDAARRVERRALQLLRRCRELRSDDAVREVARRRQDAELASAEADRARAELRAQVASWRAQERELMQAAAEATLTAAQLADRRRYLERFGDEAVCLAEVLEAAEEASARAAEAVDAARVVLTARQREARKAGEAADRADRRARRAAAVAEQRAAEDDVTDRFATPRAALGAAAPR